MLVLLVGYACCSTGRVQAADPQVVREAVNQSLALLQGCDLDFFRQSGCVACHQQSVTALAVGEARRRGFEFDVARATEQKRIAGISLRTFRERLHERVDHPLISAPSAGFILLGLAAEDYPPDEATDAFVMAMAGRQNADGSWVAFSHRPPLEYSRISATALAIRALQLCGPPGLKKKFAVQIDRGREWLIATQPASNTDDVYRLLGLKWTSSNQSLIDDEVARLRKQQRTDGGWSNLPELDSDAYATGQTLFALHTAGGVPASDPTYQRGVDYLLKTRLADGSWHVKSRSFPFQPYFESGFPHGHDQWISAFATGFATVSLMYTAPVTEPTTK
jgi:hypothetical protein